MSDLPPRVSAVLRRLPDRARLPVELAVRTVRDAAEDRVLGLAAEISFYVVLSLAPLLLGVVALAGIIGDAMGADVQASVIAAVRDVSLAIFEFDTVNEDVVPLVRDLVSEGDTRVVSFGFLVTVFAASRALRALVRAITLAYDLESARSGAAQFLRGILLTIAGFVLSLVVVPVIVAGPGLGERVVEWLGVSSDVDTVWRVAYWPLAFVLLTLFVTVLYHQATPWRTPLLRDVPGALLATTLGLLASVGLRLYSASAFGGASVYGPVAAPLALLVWLYAQSLALLLGAELNAEIEKMWPTELRQRARFEERLLERMRARLTNGGPGDRDEPAARGHQPPLPGTRPDGLLD